MKQGGVYRYAQIRPGREDDERTPYRVIVTATDQIAPDTTWVQVARVENRDPGLLMAVPFTDADPRTGWIRVDQIDTVYTPWLVGPDDSREPYGECTPETWAKIRTRLKARFGLWDDE
ncbi:hypothetical protein [Nocardia sp. NPDC056000]|uniref:hypothetical protein n=1 Tax=Nocardia sp. NPDC056000 TaxID=3345674 RepID=UPI0035D8E4FD